MICYFVYLRLSEIFVSVNNEPFAGVTVITVGDFFQLPPVGGRSVYEIYKNTWQWFESLWKYFKIFELAEVMRQSHNFQIIDF